jgi:galactokinase
MTMRERVRDAFADRFGEAPPTLVRAPGRVNLIGEHTDYNDGFVLPIAIDRDIWIALRARLDGRVQVYSLDYGASAEFDTGALVRHHAGEGWVSYLEGVAWALQQDGRALRGWDGVIGGDVPRGAGLSSSAALELAAQRAFGAVNELDWRPAAAARLGQKVENQWIGVNSGIMDQTVVAAGRAGHALLIDCRSLEIEYVPLPETTAVVVLDTATRRGLVDSAYNERRRQCEQAAAFFGVRALRDVDVGVFDARASELDPVSRRRARHVVTENARTLEAAAALRAGRVDRFGELMNASHASLRDDFQVTNEALDVMVELAQARPECFGARMTGAGFGGCAVALVEAARAEDFIRHVAGAYREATGFAPQGYVCRAAEGATAETAGQGHGQGQV